MNSLQEKGGKNSGTICDWPLHKHRRGTPMRISAILLLLIFTLQGVCRGEITELASADRKTLQDASRFHEIHAVAKLPAGIVATCADRNGKLADPGKKWNVGDAILDPAVPRKRLIWAATDNDYYVVHYEKGGLGHSYHLLVAGLKPGNETPTFVWHAVGGQLKDLATAFAAIAKHKLDDGPAYPR